MKIRTLFFSVMVIGLGLMIWGKSLTAQASIFDPPIKQALDAAPQGVSVNDYFALGSVANNSAVLANTPFGKNQAVQLTDKASQLGTVWTNDSSAMSLDSDATASMWMNFGDRNSSSGDGMAFVLQNDGRDLGASSTNSAGKPLGGETLGVWGSDQDKTKGQASDVAERAIQNSWALEFDTYSNKISGSAAPGLSSSFDDDPNLAAPYAHIASGFPSNPATYTMHATSNGYYATMNHTQPIYAGSPGWMVDGAWHHVTLKWHAADQTMTYIYDDKDPKTGDPLPNPQSRTVSVPKKAIDPGNTGKVRWGFTGSTGTRYEPNAVVFEQVPGIVNATATADIKDETTQRAVTSGTSVGAGHSLRLNYNLAYTGGSQNWKDIQAHLNLPANIDYAGGTITYGDHSLPVTQLNKTDLKSGEVTLPVEALSKENPTATITLNGDAKVGSTGQLTNKFIGANAITDARTPDFTVTAPSKSSAFHMAWTCDSQTGEATVGAKDDVPVTAQLSYDDKSTVDNSQTVLHPVINGDPQPIIPLKTTDPAGAVSYSVPQEKLQSGQTNTLQLYAEDGAGRISDKLTYTITVKSGSLDLSVPTGATFRPTTLTGHEQLIQPSDDFKVSVSDTRGSGHDWTLYAKSTTFASRFRNILPASLIYKNGDGVANLTAGFAKIESATTTGDSAVTDISKNWSANTGLLLDVQGNAIGGSHDSPALYGGTITWSFTNAPATE